MATVNVLIYYKIFLYYGLVSQIHFQTLLKKQDAIEDRF